MAKRGNIIRPCFVCEEPVNFILWPEESKKRRKKIFHWANPDGSHHIHKTKEIEGVNHLREILHDVR